MSVARLHILFKAVLRALRVEAAAVKVLIRAETGHLLRKTKWPRLLSAVLEVLKTPTITAKGERNLIEAIPEAKV
jgi:hypothetical protein